MTADLLTDLSLFMLALLVGFEVISKIPATLHTPMMSGANSIHGVVLVGAILVSGYADNFWGYVLAFLASAFAAMNVVGGYAVTDRMLGMFKARPKPSEEAKSVTTLQVVAALIYLAAAVSFVLGLHMMRSPATARRGNILSASGMTLAVAITFVALAREADTLGFAGVSRTAWIVLGAGALVGSLAGLVSARRVQMTDMPQLVSVFNAVGGGAAALVAVVDLTHRVTELDLLGGATSNLEAAFTVPVGLDILIGAVTFSGSLIAAGKLQGWVSGQPITFPGSRLLAIASALAGVGALVWLVASPGAAPLVVLAIARARASAS